MAFELNSVVPWGRNLEEYLAMFLLDSSDTQKKIAGFGDGPACFNAQASALGMSVTSFDPIYQFSKAQLEQRINEVRGIVMQQMAENKENYVWDKIRSLDELERLRMASMRKFLADYEQGKAEQRYIYHELPNRLPYPDGYFDLGLSSHFLLLYPALGYDFHIAAITEMLRVCKEVRIFPLCDLDGADSALTEQVIAHFRETYAVTVKKTGYEFQKGADQLLVISRRKNGE